MFSLNKADDLSPFVPGRRNSLLGSMNLSDVTPLEQNRPTEGAFAPNPQIWNSAPGSQGSSTKSSLSEPHDRFQSQQLHTAPLPDGFGQQPLSSFLGTRRGSSIDQHQQQLGNSGTPMQSNYKMSWSGPVEELGNWSGTREQHDLGFFAPQRRHYSLDSGVPSTYDHVNPRQDLAQQPSQQAQAPQVTLMNFNETIFDQSQPVDETDNSLMQVYRSLDFYFVQDPYNRVTIKDQTLDTLQQRFESLVKLGAQLPRFADEELPSTTMILVAFKCGRTDVFHLPSSSTLKPKIGDLVIVEADRGRDLGKVLRLDVSLDEARLLKYMQHQEQQAALASFDGLTSPPASSGNMPALHYPKPVLRFAMPNEAYQIVNKQSDEDKAKKVGSVKVESFKLDMRVVDAEYQWDRRKLTFYYTASHRIDFRELVRELFRIYKTRIWMCATVADNEPSVDDSSDLGFSSLSLNRGSLSPVTSQGQSNIWTSPLQPPSSGGNNMMDSRDFSLFVPRQLSSSNKNLWS